MKRLFLLLVVTAIIAVAVLEFHGGREARSENELVLWHSYRGDEQAALEEAVRVWNEHPAISPPMTVQVLAVPFDAYANKLTSAIPRGQGPDLFIFAHERIGDWAESGLIVPLAEMFGDNRAELDVLMPPALQAFVYRHPQDNPVGSLFGLPLASKTTALIYNKRLIDAPPRTTDEMIERMQVLTDVPNGRFGLAYEAGSFYHHSGWLFGFGGHVFRDGKIALDDPANAASFAFVAGLMRRDLLPREPSATLVAQLFNEGRAAMVINGPWFLGEIDRRIDYGVAPLPVVSATGKPATPFLTVEGIIIAKSEADRKATTALARFLALGEGARIRLEKGKQLVADCSVYDDSRVTVDPHLAAFRQQVEQSVPMPNDPRMRSIWEPAARAMRTVLRGAATPEVGLADAQQKLRIYNRDPFPRKDPRPYVVGIVVVLAGLAAFFLVRAQRRGILARVYASGRSYLYVLPTAVALLLLVLIPFVVGTAVAFFSYRHGRFSFVGLANFVSILTSADGPATQPLSFYYTLVATVMWTAANVALHVGLGLALAMALRHPWLKLRGVYRVLLIVPWAVPNYITALIWKGMFHSQFGAINGVLSWFGLAPVSWFSHFWTAFAANVATNTWLGFPFMMVVCLGALQAIPRDLEEAALMDGAGAWTRFRRVILPQIKPALVPAVVLGSVWTFNMFNIIYLVSGGEPDGATEILISEAYRWAFSRQEQYGYAAAYATLIFVVLLGYSSLTRRLTGGKETA